MKNVPIILALILAAFVLIGCMVSETTHVLYLDPDGQVTWVVLERDVRSIEEDVNERDRQEADFLATVQGGRHATVAAFDALMARSVEWRLLRDIRPFSVWTEARFERADILAQRLLEGIGIPARANLWFDNETTHLEVKILIDEAQQPTPDVRLNPLFDGEATYAIRLTRGRFVDATGFVIEDDGAVAKPAFPDENEGPSGAPLVLSLSWVGR